MTRRLTAVLAVVGVLLSTLVAGLTTTPAWAAGNFALRFTGPSVAGSNMVMTTGGPTLTTNFTLGADVRWDGTAGYLGIVSRPTTDSAGGSVTGYALVLADGRPTLAMKTVAGNRVFDAPFTLVAGRWYTLRATYSGATINIYVDGTLVGTTTYGSSSGVSAPNSTNLVIGREFNLSTDQYLIQRGFHGDIDNVVVGTGLYPGAITNLASFSFSEGSGTTTLGTGPGDMTGTLSATTTPTWVQGSDALAVTYTSGMVTGTPVTQSYRPYDPVTALAGTTFTRQGYNFNGWSRSDTAQVVAAGGTYTMPLSPLTMQATWMGQDLSFTYSPGVGSGTPVVVTSKPDLTLTLKTYVSAGFTNPGYRQTGWRIGGVDYVAGGRFVMPTTNTTATAVWTPVNQTITYSINGGTGTTPTQSPVPTGQQVTLSGASGFSRTGYLFVGWTDGGTVNYQPGDRYTVGPQAIQFSARWRALPQTITYVSSMGASGAPPVAVNAVTDARVFLSGPGSLTLAGYTFAGWDDGTGTILSPGSEYVVGSSPVTLTASWTANPQPVTYSNSEGSTGTPPTQADVTTDSSFTVASGDDLTRDGYVFAGWRDNGGSGTLVYQPGDTYEVGPQPVQLVATWQALPHMLFFGFGGGDTGTLPLGFSALSDSSVTLPSASQLSKAGYTFAGWKNVVTSTVTAAGSPFAVGTTDVFFVATWTASPQTITYSAGTGSGTVPTQSDVNTDGTFTAASSSGLTKAGYTFLGWKSGSRYYQPGDTVRVGSTAMTLTAQWVANTYNVRYFLTQSASGTPPTAHTADTESTFTLPTDSGFSKLGYTLTKWNDGTTQTSPGESYMQGIGDTNFSTVWQADLQSVTYLAGGASGSVPTQEDVATDATFTLSDGSSLTRGGYTFLGWDMSGTGYPAGASMVALPQDMTFTAQWQANLHRVVYLASRGATGSVPTPLEVATDDTFVPGGSALTLPGYSFVGWSDGDSTYHDSEIYSVSDASPDTILLTAVWDADSHTVTYDPAGATGAVPTQSDVDTDASFEVATATDLVREGYLFSGWTDGTRTFQPGDDYSVGPEDVTLTAVWTPIFLSVTYRLDGGASGEPPTQDPVEYGSDVTVAEPSGITREGEYFWGWSTGDRVYQPGESLRNVTSDVSLTATWGDHPLVTLPDTGVNAGERWTTALWALVLVAAGAACVVFVRRHRA